MFIMYLLVFPKRWKWNMQKRIIYLNRKNARGWYDVRTKKFFASHFLFHPIFLLDQKKICCVCDVDEKKMKVILYTVVFSQKRDQGLYRKNTLNLRYFIIIYFCLLYFILTLVNDVFWFYFLYYLKRKLFWQTSFEF